MLDQVSTETVVTFFSILLSGVCAWIVVEYWIFTAWERRMRRETEAEREKVRRENENRRDMLWRCRHWEQCKGILDESTNQVARG